MLARAKRLAGIIGLQKQSLRPATLIEAIPLSGAGLFLNLHLPLRLRDVYTDIARQAAGGRSAVISFHCVVCRNISADIETST